MDDRLEWWVIALRLEQWSRMQQINPRFAGVLLAGHNPHNTTPEAACEIDSPGMSSNDARMLQEAMAGRKPRALGQWLKIAKAANLRVHPMVEKYLDAVPPPAVPRKGTRDRDALSPLIKRLYAEHRECSPTKAWAELVRLAGEEHPPSPLIRFESGEIKWRGGTGTINKQQFSRRWRNCKKNAQDQLPPPSPESSSGDAGDAPSSTDALNAL